MESINRKLRDDTVGVEYCINAKWSTLLHLLSLLPGEPQHAVRA